MSVRLEQETIHLEGECPLEDAEPLLALLRAAPARRVALTAAGPMHTAVVQVLMALRPTVEDPVPGSLDPKGAAPEGASLEATGGDAFFHRWLKPLLVCGTSG